MFTLNATLRRVVYVSVFETLAVIFSTFLLSAFSDSDPAASLPVAIIVSTIAVVWNFIFNTGFEAAERSLGLTRRTLKLRVIHSLLFEGGIVLFTVPLFMYWYQVSFIQAFVMEAAILLFFLIYTFSFTWVFDLIFTLPNQAARAKNAAGSGAENSPAA